VVSGNDFNERGRGERREQEERFLTRICRMKKIYRDKRDGKDKKKFFIRTVI
jgi:hypothetical protein